MALWRQMYGTLSLWHYEVHEMPRGAPVAMHQGDATGDEWTKGWSVTTEKVALLLALVYNSIYYCYQGVRRKRCL
ncbi:MAG: hypothetical protein LBG97_07890 [Coriobacteriales bacterium]|nr:hypothetical protein [Coriobacteriales bacterium]